MATTTNYGWTTPDDTALVKDGASAIRTLGSSVDTTTKNLNPETTLGDIVYRSSTANVKTRLGIGSAGNVLTVAGGVPSWAAPVASTPTFAGCSLYKTSSQTISNTTNTAITFEAEHFDTNTYHDNSTNNTRITIPAGKAGYYLLNGYVAIDGNSTGERQITIFKNGSAVAQMTGGISMLSVKANINFNYTLYLAENDYVQLYVYQTSGGTLDVKSNSSETTFIASLLGA